MNRLVKLQLRNIFHNKLFYVCLGISLLINIGVTYVSEIIAKTPTSTTAMTAVISQFTSGVDIIGMVFITIFCTFDFSEGTTKNIIARGYTKTQLLFSKYIASLIGILTMILLMSVLSFILYIKNGLGFEANMGNQFIVALFSILAYTVFYGTIAFTLEKTSSAIIANMFAPNIFALILGLADSNLKVNMTKYWISNVGTTFSNSPTLTNMTFPIIMYIIYIVVFSFIGIYIAKNKEIK